MHVKKPSTLRPAASLRMSALGLGCVKTRRCATAIEFDARKNILVTLQFFAFSHSQGQKRTFALQKLCPLNPRKRTLFDAHGSAENLGARLTVQRALPFHRTGVINHCVSFALWYRRKRAKVDQGGGIFRTSGRSARGWKLEISIDDLAAARKSTGLGHLGRRFHRIYHVT